MFHRRELVGPYRKYSIRNGDTFEEIMGDNIHEARMNAKSLLYDMGGEPLYNAIQDPLFDTLFDHYKGDGLQPSEYSILDLAYIVLLMPTLIKSAKANSRDFFCKGHPGLLAFYSGVFYEDLSSRLYLKKKKEIVKELDYSFSIGYGYPIIQAFYAASRRLYIEKDIGNQLVGDRLKMGIFHELVHHPYLEKCVFALGHIKKWIDIKVIIFASLPALVTVFMTMYY